MNPLYELILPVDFDERAEYEAEQRGLLDHVKVRFANGQAYSICFFTPSRIAVELAVIREAGEACFAEPGLLVIPSITRDEMDKAIGFLATAGYFERLKSDS